jgi:hypothetical protein
MSMMSPLPESHQTTLVKPRYWRQTARQFDITRLCTNPKSPKSSDFFIFYSALSSVSKSTAVTSPSLFKLITRD